MTTNALQRSNFRKNLVLIVKSGISIGLLFFLLSNYSLEESFLKLGNDGILKFLVAVGVLLAGLFLGAYRWWELIRMTGPSLSYPICSKLTMVGHFFNQILPSSIGGDAIKVWSTYKLGLTLSHATTSTLLDRIVGLFGLLILIIIGIPFLMMRTSSPYVLITLITITTSLAIGLLTLLILDRIPLIARRWSASSKLGEFSAQLRATLCNPRKVITLLTVSIISHIMVLALGQYFSSAMGTDLSFQEVILIFPAVILVSSLPFSVAGWGVREAGMAAGFVVLGLPADTGVTVSILIGLANVLAGIPGGILWSISMIPNKHS